MPKDPPRIPISSEAVLKVLTPIQRRRMVKFLDGQTLTQIAKEDSVSVETIRESITAAKKRIKKRLELS